MADESVYIQHADDGPEDGPRPFGESSWAIVDESEGGIVAWAGTLSRAILIRNEIANSRRIRVGDRIVTRDTQAVWDYGLEPGWRGRVTHVRDDGGILFLTDGEEDGDWPWQALPIHVQRDN